MLGVALVCVFLPQPALFVPFAAFFVAVCLVLCIFDAARKAALCILPVSYTHLDVYKRQHLGAVNFAQNR